MTGVRGYSSNRRRLQQYKYSDTRTSQFTTAHGVEKNKSSKEEQ